MLAGGARGARSPSILALTRQNLPALRAAMSRRTSARAAPTKSRRPPGKRRFRSSPRARKCRSRSPPRRCSPQKGVAARVVSVPCMERFAEQGESYRKQVMGDARVRVGVEAAVRQGWDALIGDGPFVGMTRIRRQRAVQATLRAFRHHRREGGRGGAGAAGRLTQKCDKKTAFLDLDQSGAPNCC